MEATSGKGANKAQAKPAKVAAKAAKVVVLDVPPVAARAPDPFAELSKALGKIGEDVAKNAGEAAAFVGRFASDAAFRDSVLFQSVEVAQVAEGILCTLATVTNDPTTRWLCGRAQVLARGAEELRRRVK